MKRAGLVSLFVTSAAMVLQLAAPGASLAGMARNIIFMVPDGMGLANVTAARIYRNGLNGAPLNFETLQQIGYQRTYSANSTITDSAAAASAWACGPQAELFKAGQQVEAGWTSGKHTGVDTLVWSEGPGSEALARAIDNTDIYGVMVRAMAGRKE